jgi:hypothetical protein
MRSSIFGHVTPYVNRDDIYIGVNLAGLLQYKWRDTDGHVINRKSPFRTRVVLGHLETASECGEGGEKEPLNTTKPLTLKLDQTGYRLPIEFQRSIAAGRVARYSLPIRAPKSSRHKYKVVLELADGREINSRPIDLLYFVPNMWGRKINQ